MIMIEQYESQTFSPRPLIDWVYDDIVKFDDDLKHRYVHVIIDPEYEKSKPKSKICVDPFK
jgi:hypothetical protein